jgi:hypothetical protein
MGAVLSCSLFSQHLCLADVIIDVLELFSGPVARRLNGKRRKVWTFRPIATSRDLSPTCQAKYQPCQKFCQAESPDFAKERRILEINIHTRKRGPRSEKDVVC